jgi:hypothetical protein
MKELEKQMFEIFQELSARGFETPVHFAFVAINGSIMGGTLESNGMGGYEPVFNTQFMVAGEMKLPINMMFIKQNGQAARVVLEQSGPTWIWN